MRNSRHCRDASFSWYRAVWKTGNKICNAWRADWVRAQCCSFVVIDHSERLAEVVVHHLLTSSVLSLAHGLWFFPKLGLAPTPEGLNDVSDWCARLWFT